METAFITGASGGIGLEIAKIFAQNKVNLILVARSESKLNDLAKELKQQNVDVKIYVKDLSILANAEEIYNDIKKQNIVIDYVINNAGFGTSGIFTDTEWNKDLEMLNLNIITLTYFTKIFGNDMKKRGCGKILNVASTGAYQPVPYMSAYAATKAYVLNLSEAANYELRRTGVSISSLCPGYTETGFADTAKIVGTKMVANKSTTATAKDVAEYGYKLMMKNKSSGIHGKLNNLMVFFQRFVPKKIVIKIAGSLLGKN